MKKQVILLIEGTPDDTNGNLKIGFGSLLEQKLRGNMPRIVMSGNKSETCKKFKNPLQNQANFLLIDLDAPESDREQEIIKQGLVDVQESVFFMIHEMEAWILSQPNVLDEYYKEKISVKITRKAHEISNPDDFLQILTKKTEKGAYHKVGNGVELLKMLSLSKLEESFPDVKRLIQTFLPR